MDSHGLTVGDYGWTDSNSAPAHEYILPELIQTLQRRNARRVLDLGCGNGSLTHALCRRGFEVVGCDVDRNGIEIARRGGGEFRMLSVYDDPSELGRCDFDAVVAVEVIEHLFLPGFLPAFAHAVLRDGGCLVVTTPYHGYLKNLAIALTNRWDAHVHPLRDGGHIKFWSRATLSQLLVEHGFSIRQIRGVGRLPFLWKSMMICAEKRANGDPFGG